MGSERIHPLSKPQAIAAVATSAVLLLGWVWKTADATPLLLSVIYLLVTSAIVLIGVVTASRTEYTKGLCRALKVGRARLPWWDDLALNPVCVLVICGLVLAAGTVAWDGASKPAWDQDRVSSSAYSFALATGVLVTAYFGLALQYFLLRFGARGRIFFGLFLFLAWLLPLVAGVILAAAATAPLPRDAMAAVVSSLSPIVGVGAMALPVDHERQKLAIQGAAITPALFFTFVFHSLLVGRGGDYTRSWPAPTRREA